MKQYLAFKIKDILCFVVVVKIFQEYVEPEGGYQGSPQRRGPSGQDEENIALPLGENVLTHNLGIPVVVVCTKVSLKSHSLPKKPHNLYTMELNLVTSKNEI